LQVEERVLVVDPVEDVVVEDTSNRLESMMEMTVDNNMFGLGDETLARVKSYRDVVTGVFGQLERTARAQDLTVGDLVFDIVKEVIADTLSGLFARGLGLHTTARNGGDFSFINTVLGAVSKVASGQRC